MMTFFIRRVLLAILTIVCVTLIVFFMLRSLPGDPLLMVLSRDQYSTRTQEEIENLRHEYGLDKPVVYQYFDWVSDIFHGDLGKSTYYSDSINVLISRRLPVTLYLGLSAFVVANVIGVAAGTLSALKRGTRLDTFITILSNIGITIPIFWLGIMLIYIFGFKLEWLPTNGYTSPFSNFTLSIKQMIMPVACESVFTIGAITRQTRSSMLEVKSQDYIRTAWAKGLSERLIVMKHLLKNGLIPIVTLSGMQLGYIIGGAVLIETVFNIPGMGRLSVDAVRALDYSVVEAIVLIIAVIVALVNLIVDISYGWLDPRIRYS